MCFHIRDWTERILCLIQRDNAIYIERIAIVDRRYDKFEEKKSWRVILVTSRDMTIINNFYRAQAFIVSSRHTFIFPRPFNSLITVVTRRDVIAFDKFRPIKVTKRFTQNPKTYMKLLERFRYLQRAKK